MIHAPSTTVAVFLGLLLSFAVGTALADVESARKHLADAARHLKDGDGNRARTSLDLADAELDGVPEAEAGPLRNELDTLRQALAGAAAGAEKKKLVGEIDSALRRIKRWMDDERFDEADRACRDLESALNDPANRKVLGDADAAAYLKQVAPLRKVAGKRLIADKVAALDGRLKVVEEEWPKTIDEILGKDTRSSQEYAIRAGRDTLDRLEHMLGELPPDDESVKPLATRLEKLREQYASAASSGTASASIDRVASRLQSVEADWADLIAAMKDPEREGVADSAARDAHTKLEMLNSLIADLPPGDERVKALVDRRAKLQAEFEQVYASAGAARVAARLQRYWDGAKDDWQGWESESTGPTFHDFALKGGDSDERYFNLRKTIALRQQADQFLEQLEGDDAYKAAAETLAVKALVDDVRAKRRQAYDKIVKAATAVVAEAEQASLDNVKLMAVQYMDGNLLTALGEKSPDYQSLIERRDAILKKHADAVAANEKAAKDAFNKLSAEAEKGWPALASKFTDAQDGFDPGSTKVGQTVRLKGINNRMGWDYGSDTLPFASRWNGKPFAARFDPVVSEAFTAVRKQIGGERISDNGWDVIAVVESGTARITERVRAEVRNAGGSSVGSLERWDPIEVPVIRIVAVHAGPVAVAVGAGAVNADGKVERPLSGPADTGGTTGRATGSTAATLATVAGAGGRGGAWAWLGLTVLVGLAAAGALLLKAGYAPLAAVPQVGAVQARLGSERLALIGLASAAVGAVLLARGLVVFGLLTNLSIIAAGLLAATDWLVARGLVKPDLAVRLGPWAAPVGLTCASLVVVRLISALLGINLYVV